MLEPLGRGSSPRAAGAPSELIALSDRIEEMNVRRMEHVVQLAGLRRTSVDALMDELGLKSPVYE